MSIISKVLQPCASAAPLAGFALAWRWQPEGRHPLAPAVLAQLQGLGRVQAQAAFRISCALQQQGRPSPTRYAVARHDAASSACAEVRAWLQACGPAARTRVWLSWEPELALCTGWGVFTQHWQAFCYPGSDDLVVFPASRRWAMVYHHTQRLEFHRWQRTARGPRTPTLRKASGQLQDMPPTPAG